MFLGKSCLVEGCVGVPPNKKKESDGVVFPPWMIFWFVSADFVLNRFCFRMLF